METIQGILWKAMARDCNGIHQLTYSHGNPCGSPRTLVQSWVNSCWFSITIFFGFPLPMLRTKIHSSSVRTRTSYDVICYVVYECSKKCDISPSPRSCRSGSPHQLLKVFGLDRWTGTNADKVLYGYCGGWSRINRFMWFYMVLYNFHIWLQ